MTTENNIAWIDRFGTLEDVTERKTAAGEAYVTFKMQCGKFDQYGAAFKEDAVAFLLGAKGKNIWVKGPLNPRSIQKDGETKEVMNFTVIYFAERAAAAKPVAEEAEAAA